MLVRIRMDFSWDRSGSKTDLTAFDARFILDYNRLGKALPGAKLSRLHK
jgi:hypothetical protein